MMFFWWGDIKLRHVETNPPLFFLFSNKFIFARFPVVTTCWASFQEKWLLTWCFFFPSFLWSYTIKPPFAKWESVTKVPVGGIVSHLVQKLSREKRFTMLIGSWDTASAHTHTDRAPNPLSSIMKELQMGCREIGVERGKWEKRGERQEEGRRQKNGEKDEEEREAGDRDAGQDKRMNAEGSNEEETLWWREHRKSQTGRGKLQGWLRSGLSNNNVSLPWKQTFLSAQEAEK